MCEGIADSTDDVGCRFARQITCLCYEHYKTRLSKNGKPQKNCEWTLLAAVVQSVHPEEGCVIVHRLCVYSLLCRVPTRSYRCTAVLNYY